MTALHTEKPAATGNGNNEQSELELKVFKVLAAFSQSLEKSLITSQTSVNELCRSLNQAPKTGQQELKSISQLSDQTNVGLLTIQMVRCVIQRADSLSNQIAALQHSVAASKSSSNLSINNNNSINNQQQQQQVERKKEVALAPPSGSSSPSDTSRSNNSSNSNSNLSIGGSSTKTLGKTRNSSDFDTKYQTEMQLNAMLSEFLKEDFEIASTLSDDSQLDGGDVLVQTEIEETADLKQTSSSKSPMGASATLGSSGSSLNISPLSRSTSSMSPAANPGTTSPNQFQSMGNLQNVDSPGRQPGSTTGGGNNNNGGGGSGGGSGGGPPKKAYLTDLLDQIDQENGGKDKKKGKFKFF
ncbi:hypothetical protein SAMD00019534_032110 [Acytostelium subglobosum LB1]|uniref:hypothetical protein n=1 Tax=Acytostelium subglobosum LB1 TaxID=1410327 RepID=UPI000644D6FB|nr:hypothetical protein SAMD00019534_032110 [Acytostelium subglobosum LB1]GAM20036.1 hypothetical protein SAMD00019534_032110 [Acytostelium subglobosum LB1]|eukprot:XP_012756798.1 hypothetical protein SAMD00019534_032110 [Acytostelium subglobosum LB1]